MAQMSISRALTKLKTVKAKIDRQIEAIEENGGLNNKALSAFSAENAFAKNHAEATKKVEGYCDSIRDLLAYYRQVSLIIQKSNLETMISTEHFGVISVTDALCITCGLKSHYVDYSTALRRATRAAEFSAQQYNDKHLNKALQESLDSEVLAKIAAQPLVLFSAKRREQAEEMNEFVKIELNELINESNACTFVEVPDMPA